MLCVYRVFSSGWCRRMGSEVSGKASDCPAAMPPCFFLTGSSARHNSWKATQKSYEFCIRKQQLLLQYQRKWELVSPKACPVDQHERVI